jgi:hypothetical protein
LRSPFAASIRRSDSSTSCLGVTRPSRTAAASSARLTAGYPSLPAGSNVKDTEFMQ